MRVREAGAEGAAALASLLAQLGYPASEEDVAGRVERLLVDPAYALLVAAEDERVVGFAALRARATLEHEHPVGHVEGLVVDGAHRGRGVGGALMRAAEAEARSRCCEILFLTSAAERADAHAFYERSGFTRTGLRFTKMLS
jgi:ribosomal protein S18 acetylase RimI-like enzyme